MVQTTMLKIISEKILTLDLFTEITTYFLLKNLAGHHGLHKQTKKLPIS